MKKIPMGIHNKLQRCLFAVHFADGTNVERKFTYTEEEIREKIKITWEIGITNQLKGNIVDHFPAHTIQKIRVTVLEEFDYENKVWRSK